MAKGTKGIPDIMGPLNVPAQPGDSLVPQNDMGGVAPEFSKGTSAPDPLGVMIKSGNK